ncbi:DUF1659 domain-containing protein [Litchfieldia salsa]|uniref:DUF1659 domain-containing protein n=1 Tax=Litchfieldia salsa TaxID=930152 RepID=A0A1H0W785_9BACI|nr:DUF1659 domain-containing protein [Litchfieldia salsa]SDP86600.1 Protein of unknown function [Litchfieldia salsa]
MAEQFLASSQLRLVFELGVDEKGEMKYKNKNYNVKTTSTPEQLFAAASAILGLQSLKNAGFVRNDSHDLI